MSQVITQRQAADLTGVTARRLQQLAHEADAPPRDGDGYPCKAFGDWLRRRVVAGLGVAEDGRIYDYEAERARFTHHQANKAALEEQVLQNKLIPAEDVERVWSGMIAAARAKLLAVPTRAAQAVITTADIAEAETIIREAIHDALAELADHDPSQYREPGGGQAAAPMETATEADGKPVGGRRKATVKRSQRRARPVEH